LVETNKSLTLDFGSVSLRKDGIVEITFFKGYTIDLPQCEALLKVYDTILESKKYPLLHLVEEFVDATKEAREFSASKRGLQYSSAEAYVFNSLPYRIIANFYLKINQPAVPTKFFKTKQEAVAWLLKFKK